MNKIAGLILFLLAASFNAAAADDAAGGSASWRVKFDVVADQKLLWSGEISNGWRLERFELAGLPAGQYGNPRLIVDASAGDTGCHGVFFGEERVVGFDRYEASGASISFPHVKLVGKCIFGRRLEDLAGTTIDIGVLDGGESHESYRLVFHRSEESPIDADATAR